jgi:excisionase family DNA binding protein
MKNLGGALLLDGTAVALVDLKEVESSNVGPVAGVSRSKVYELLELGSIPSVYIGRSRRIRVSDVEAFVAGGGREY